MPVKKRQVILNQTNEIAKRYGIGECWADFRSTVSSPQCGIDRDCNRDEALLPVRQAL